jgi:hypothetical protein
VPVNGSAIERPAARYGAKAFVWMHRCGSNFLQF